MKLRASSSLLIGIILILLCGCARGKDSLLGTWTATIGSITISREFKDDGTVIERVNDTLLRMEGTYTTEEGKISIAMTTMINEESGISLPFEVNWNFSYSVKDNKLTLIDLNLDDIEEIVYTKK